MKKRKATAKPQKEHNLLKLTNDFFKSHPVLITCSFLAIFFSSFYSIVGAVAVQKITSGLQVIIDGSMNANDFVHNILGPNIIAFTIVCAISIALIIFYSVTLAIVGQDYMDRLRRRVFAHMQDLPIEYFDKHQRGDIMSVYTNDIDTIRQFIIQSLISIIANGLTGIVILVYMVMISIPLSVVVVVGIALMFVAGTIITIKAMKYFVAQQKALGRQEGLVEEMMGGLKVVKSFNHEAEANKDFGKVNETLRAASTNANASVSEVGPVMNSIGNLMLVLVITVGVAMFALKLANPAFIKGVIDNNPQFGFFMDAMTDFGVVVTFMSLLPRFNGLVNDTAQQMSYVGMANAGAGRVFTLLNQAPEADNGYVELARGYWQKDGGFKEIKKPKVDADWAWRHPHKSDGSITYAKVRGEIRMFDVDFGYEPDKLVLHNVSLYAKPGQRIAFVGATGAGKTTITNLINRFYDIADGKIRYDGININKIKKKDLRQTLGMVLQDTSLFTGTVRENIRYGRLDATNKEVEQAAKLVKADSFIKMLPKAYDTVISGDGSSLSQGQCQLLSIARAALADPPVLILDEATSSIDTRTEALVTKGMNQLMEGRTVFVIAHRLSTIRECKAIMVLEHGRIIERGTHEQLLKQKGMYYQLYTGAFELE